MMGSGSISEGNSSWVSFFRRANEFIDSGELEDCENRYKREVARSLRKARKVLPTGSDELAELVEKGLDSNLIDFRIRQNVRKWMDDYPDDASETLEAIWTRDRMPLEQRIRAFCERFPREVIGGAAGTLMNLASVLLMSLDEERYPPFRIKLANKVYKLTGYDSPGSKADEATLYRHFLGFLDRFKEESQVHGLNLRHRLDTQSLIWRSQEEEDPFVLPQIGSTQPHPDGSHQDDWIEFVNRVNDFIESGTLKKWVEDKLELGREMAEAREAVINNDEDWIGKLENKGLSDRDGHPIFWNLRIPLVDWIHRSPEKAREALQKLWTEDTLCASSRIRAFCELVPESAVPGGRGTRARVASALLLGLDSKNYPPYAPKTFGKAYTQTGFSPPPKEADEAELYDDALSFLDCFLQEAQEHGLHLLHRHDIRTVTWWCLNKAEPPVRLPKIGKSETQFRRCDMRALSDELLLSFEFLKEIETLVVDKRQVIFQGPPGTGKTYVAQALAKCLTGSKDRVKLIQFHPSYAYEDFVRGFRPTITESGQAGFDLQDGPLLRAAQEARMEPDAKHILIIDEINRGNIAKVFGESYFLLEYRDKEIRMQYQRKGEEDFSLPNNLYIIGTMNTADRSIALVDLALRRRFYFVEFHPDDEPVKGVLRRWLEKNELNEMLWVADLVEEANRLLEKDRHAAIGPSYLMKKRLDEDIIRRIWKHSVRPYIEERLFGDDDRIKEFHFDKLKEKADQTHKQNSKQPGKSANGEDGRIE